MDFYPYEPFDTNEAQKRVWNWLKEAFKDDEGVSYYRYPIFQKSGQLNREPDFLILHKDFGLWVIECKSYSIDNIRGIQGHEWKMSYWYNEIEMPVAQAEDQMFALKSKLDEKRQSRGKVSFNFRVALPNIKASDWKEKGFNDLPSTEGAILTYDSLTPAAFRKQLEEGKNYQKPLSEEEWKLVRSVLGGTLPQVEPRNIPTATPPDNPIRVISHIQNELKPLDEIQGQVAFAIPEGPQRFRGLAGTGKTVLLAKRVAKLHIKYPDWTISFVFFTRSLYDQIIELIATFHREMHPESKDPNWKKVKVLHAWGARDQDGFYRTLAQKSGVRPKSLNDVVNEIGRSSPSKSFEYICECLKRDAGNIPVLYDAIVIDEGQDLPPIFYKLVYETCSDPRRIYWAYDEAQGIGSLMIPTSEQMFGRDEQGNLLVDVSGQYPGGIVKSQKMKKCYRTPRLLLMTAHAINMGLFRKEEALQGVTDRSDWRDLGYKVIKGDFTDASVKSRKAVTITRPDEESPHPIDQPSFNLEEALGSVLTIQTFSRESEEQEWIAQQVAKDIELGFDPWDMMITALCGNQEKDYLSELKNALARYDIDSYIAGVDNSQSIFRMDGCVTISNIFRAKGNEAWKVYACRFNYATQPLAWKKESEIHKRNEAFVALTRSRVWAVVTGIDNPIFDELEEANQQYPEFTFTAFNKNSLKRITEDN
jgi:superfamily I DNA and RNA helicase